MQRVIERIQYMPFEREDDGNEIDTDHTSVIASEDATEVKINVDQDSDNSSSEKDTDEDNIEAIFAEVRQIYKQELKETISDYSKTVSGNVGDHDIHDAIDKIISSSDENSTVHGDFTCTDCCKEKRVEQVASLKRGQHVTFPGQHLTFNVDENLYSLYKHHAIIKEVSKTGGQKVELVLIHFTKQGQQIGIYQTTETFDLEKDEIHIIKYVYPRYSPDEIVCRAEAELMKREQFKEYNLVTQNCEHFAVWCVVGKQESYQVKGHVRTISKLVKSGFDVGSKLGGFIKRFTDKFAKGVHAIKLPGILLGGTILLNLCYCTYKTLKYRSKLKNGEICSACCKREVTGLWRKFGVFVSTSGLSYIIAHFCLPLLGPAGIPCLLVLVLLSVGLQWGIEKVAKKLMSPYACDKNKISCLSDIRIGDILSYKYCLIPHNAIVTEVHAENEKTGSIRCVHYGLKNWNVFGTREVIEEYLQVNLYKESIYVLDCTHLNRYPPEKTVERVRKRVGERKWNEVSNRSDHLCFWSSVRQDTDDSVVNTHCNDIGKSKSNHRSSLKLKDKDVHLREEVQIGHVVEYTKRSDKSCEKENYEKVKVTGIVVCLEGTDDREFQMQLIFYKNKRSERKKCNVDLNKDRLIIKMYHPAHCYTMDERVQRACEGWGKSTEYKKNKHFIESCILKNVK